MLIMPNNVLMEPKIHDNIGQLQNIVRAHAEVIPVAVLFMECMHSAVKLHMNVHVCTRHCTRHHCKARINIIQYTTTVLVTIPGGRLSWLPSMFLGTHYSTVSQRC